MAYMSMNIPVKHLVVMPDGTRRAYDSLGSRSWNPMYESDSAITIPVDLFTAFKLGMIYDYELPDHLRAWWKLTLENN